MCNHYHDEKGKKEQVFDDLKKKKKKTMNLHLCFVHTQKCIIYCVYTLSSNEEKHRSIDKQALLLQLNMSTGSVLLAT